MASLHSSAKSLAASRAIAAWASGSAAAPDLPALVRLRRTLHALSRSVIVRALVPIVFLACHLGAMYRLGEDRWGVPFDVAPTSPPTFVSPGTEAAPATWSRLV